MRGQLAAVKTWVASRPVGRAFDVAAGEMGLLQRWYAAQPTSRVVIAVLELDAELTRSRVEPALRALCARHAEALGHCEERGPLRLRVRPLAAAEPLPWLESTLAPWPLAAALAHTSFAAGAPLFRVAIAGGSLLLALDHLIADGVSAALLASELARLLAGQTLAPRSDRSALPLDARLGLRPSLAQIARKLRAPRARYLNAPRAQVAPGALHTALATCQLERVQLHALRERAHAHEVTVHAALSSAALLSALSALDQPAGCVRMATPVSLRALCDPAPDGSGVYIAGVESDYDIPYNYAPWLLAQRYQRDLREQREGAHGGVGMLALAGDLSALARRLERQAQGRTATVEVSNVGMVQGLPQGARLWLTQGVHYHAALFVLTVATSSSDGVLRVCLSYPAPLIDAARAERYLKALQRHIDALLHS